MDEHIYHEQCHDTPILDDLKKKVEELENQVAYLIQKDKTEQRRIREETRLHDFYMGRSHG